MGQGHASITVYYKEYTFDVHHRLTLCIFKNTSFYKQKNSHIELHRLKIKQNKNKTKHNIVKITNHHKRISQEIINYNIRVEI